MDPTAPRRAPLALALLLAGCGSSMSIPTTPSTPQPPTAAPAPTPAPSPEPAPTPPPSAPTVLRVAVLGGVNGHAASGRARIVREAGAHRLELLDDFRIDNGSTDLYLARQASTVTRSDLNLGELRSARGAQDYRLPDDGAAYSHVVLWCRPFRIPIGAGALR